MFFGWWAASHQLQVDGIFFIQVWKFPVRWMYKMNEWLFVCRIICIWICVALDENNLKRQLRIPRSHPRSALARRANKRCDRGSTHLRLSNQFPRPVFCHNTWRFFSVFVRLKRSKIRVILGDHDQYVTTDAPAIMRAVSSIIRHRNFDVNSYNHDIALLKLRKSVPLGKTIRPVCLPVSGQCDRAERQAQGLSPSYAKTVLSSRKNELD